MRLRITLVVTAVMAPVLAVTGMYLYTRFGHDLDSAIDSGLRSRAMDVSELVRNSEGGLDLRHMPRRSEVGFAEVLDEQGRIAGATQSLQGRTLLTAAERVAALQAPRLIDRPAETAMREPSRLLARPLVVGGRRMIVVVGTPTRSRTESLEDLGSLFLVGGPIALLVAALAAYGGAAAALRPVEAMRARAAEISAAEPQERLPVPYGDDEIGRLGVTLNAMLGRLGDALTRERRFVADASHELRTPLAILKAELELALAKDPGRPERSREELERALMSAADETDRLTKLAEDLLMLAQSDRDALPVNPHEVELASLLEEVARHFEPRVAASGRVLEVRCEAGLVAEVDPLRLGQAIGNLLDNALRHGAGTIELSAACSSGELHVHVADRGRGVPEDFLGHAFERFTRADHSSGGGGTGLGLSITASIAAAHHGRARLANRAEGGADAWLELPVATHLKAPV